MSICSDANEGNIAEVLLEYKTIDIDVYKIFLDCSIPSISVHSYMRMSTIEPLSTIVTLAEESFAILILENNWRRWVYQARKSITAAESDNDEAEPILLYQKNITKRSDGKSSAGQWTNEGLERYNEIVSILETKRRERNQFEDDLKDIYIMEMNEHEKEKSHKRKATAIIDTKRAKERVTVVNTIDFVSLM